MSTAGKPPVDLERLSRTMGGDLHAELDVLRIFIEQTDKHLRSVEASLAAENWAKIYDYAHTIKGASANIGADRMQELAASLEGRIKNGEHAQVAPMVKEVREAFEAVRAFFEEHRRRMLG